MDTELNAGRSNPITQQFTLHNLKRIQVRYLKKSECCVAALKWLIPDSDENAKYQAWKMHLDFPGRNMRKCSISIGLENESSRGSHTGSNSICCWMFHDIQVKTI